MLTLNAGIPKCTLALFKINFVISLFVLITFSANAQLPGQLPVNLKTFKARAENNNKVKIFWTTEYEKDNGHFDIELSADGVLFFVVGKVPGVNHNGSLTDYVFYDHHAVKGISFYRLKQVDVDGKYNYSAIERVRNSGTDNASDMYPNPAPGNEFKINLLKNCPGYINIVIYDLSGRLQWQQSFSNSNTLTINHHLATGLYTVKIQAKDFTETKQLIIQ